MVKVFLCETAKDCFSRLQSLLREIKDSCVLFPSMHFYTQFTHFYPQVDSAVLFTPEQLLHCLNTGSYNEEVAFLSNEYDGSIDPNLFFLTSDIKEKLSNVGFSSEHLANNDFAFKNCILFGPYPENIQAVLLEKLNKIFESVFIVKRSFKNLSELPKHVKSYHVQNSTEEKLWVQKRLKQNESVPFVTFYTDEIITLFDEPYDPIKSSWIAWQEQGTLGSFLIYLRNVTQDDNLFASYKKDLNEAYNQCLIEDFSTLRQYLLEHNKAWIKDFTHEVFPPKANLDEYIQIFQQTTFASIISEKTYEYLSHCSLPYTKNQFFAYLRKVFKIHEDISTKKCLHWREAIYFPIKNCYVVHALKDAWNDKNQLSWLIEVANEGGNIDICAPLRDEKGISLNPLLEANTNEDFSAKFNQEKLDFPQNFTLPKERIKLSCKGWERFYLCPRRTWLDAILKANPTALNNPCLKAKIFGEWVHGNLEFKLPPKSLLEWKQNITKNANYRWQQLTQQLGDKLPYVFTQWHSRALALSYKMAQACEDLLKEGWQLFSEYPLPNNAEYRGRIDLLAIRNDQAVIIDYKTATYSFTKQQISQGHGLQLLLYGRQLQKTYENITLRVVDKNGNNLSLNLSDISESVENIEMWMKNVIQTGLYESLPQEKANTLPLCWPKAN